MKQQIGYSLFAISGLLISTQVFAEHGFARLYKGQYGFMPSCNACHVDGGGSPMNSYGKAFEQAKAAVAEGKVVLIFPEGTRRAEGTLGTFKPLVGRLSLACDVDILPLYLDGAFEALPRGSSLPKARDLAVHIGPVLEVGELRRLTAGERPTEQARQAAALAQRAIAALRDGQPLELSAYGSVDDALAGQPSTTAAAETSCG